VLMRCLSRLSIMLGDLAEKPTKPHKTERSDNESKGKTPMLAGASRNLRERGSRSLSSAKRGKVAETQLDR
jgi:hypothetical protein